MYSVTNFVYGICSVHSFEIVRATELLTMYGSMDQKSNNKMLHEQASQRKAEADTNYFWDLVNRYKANPPNARKLNPAHEERILFAEKQNTESRVQGDNIPVERSGPDCDKVPALETFKDLEYHVPSYTMRNIGLLKYETPTPIQKHAIPLGLSGADLMCCAQTVSLHLDCSLLFLTYIFLGFW